MKWGKRQEDSEANPSQQGIFSITGPVHLTSVDWEIPHHRRSVAASLVQGVYTLERDRQNKRNGSKALAPLWWEFFHFKCIQILEDQLDSSTFGAIYEYNPPMAPHTSVPPRYVIAFRGTLIEPDTRKQDLSLNLHIALNGLARRTRYQTAFQALEGIIGNAGQKRVWLAGHSLGAAIALQAGKDMAKRGFYLETYLFNPPFPSVPLEKIKDPNLKNGFRFAGRVITAGVSLAMQGKKFSKQEHDSFSMLCAWIPNLFVNPTDPICCEYIGYFEHRETVEEMGVSVIERIASRNTVVSVLAGALGKDGEPLHLIPSALLTKNMSVVPQDFKQAHGIQQWWEPHPYWQFKLYQLK